MEVCTSSLPLHTPVHYTLGAATSPRYLLHVQSIRVSIATSQTRRPRAARDLAARLSLIFPYWAINWSELCRTSPHTTTSNTYDAPSYTAHTMSLPRLAQRFAQRSPTLRTAIQRRFESQVTISSASDKLPLPGKKLTGAADNAFNRERAAVKAHAAATSGIPLPSAASRSSIANL